MHIACTWPYRLPGVFQIFSCLLMDSLFSNFSFKNFLVRLLLAPTVNNTSGSFNVEQLLLIVFDKYPVARAICRGWIRSNKTSSEIVNFIGWPDKSNSDDSLGLWHWGNFKPILPVPVAASLLVFTATVIVRLLAFNNTLKLERGVLD